MKKYLLVLCLLCVNYLIAQPNLPSKENLATTLFSSKTFSNATTADLQQNTFTDAGDYTLEVIAKVNSAIGRGLDIEARNKVLTGFRLSLDASSLKSTIPLNSPLSLSNSRSGEYHTIRVAVRGDSAHFYQNGVFLYSLATAQVKDIVNGVESDQVSGVTLDNTNLVNNWAGTAPNNAGRPDAYGWGYTPEPTSYATFFTVANGGSNMRFMDSSASNQNKYSGSAGAFYSGRVLYIRWDGSATSYVYYLPVTLEANKTYNFSMLAGYLSNAPGNKTIVVGIGKTKAVADRIATRNFVTGDARVLAKGDLYFTSQEAGQYYLTFTGPASLYAIADLQLKKYDAIPRFIFGKNYTSGAVDMEISAATYETGAYAPASLVTTGRQTQSLSGTTVNLPTSFNTDFTVSGKTDVHFTGESTPYGNSSIALNSNDAWLFFDNVKPAKVLSTYISTVTINGAAAVNNTNFRIAQYKNGTVIIPNGNLTNNAALEVFQETGFSGTAQTYPINTVHNNLGAFNNSIRSFKLKRGYVATFANNADGTGYSRVFVANDADLEITAMPQGLDGTASFIRVMKWNWPSKKGKAGWSPDKINATWYYDWNISGDASNPNYEYQSIRQTQYWPGFGDIINKNVNHILGFNEPDRPDQANMTVEQCFSAWPGLLTTGLRVGSPAPANPESSWITDFLKKTDSANYRVDFVAIHCYWGGATPSQWYSRLKGIYDRVKRPLWITEWNNGANWTTETWPTDIPGQLQKQLADMKGILQVLDTASFIERYAEYDWVENKRALVLADTLTPAGKYYASTKSDFAYRTNWAFTHTWKLASPTPAATINAADYTKVTLSWTDLNGETGSKYILERKIDGVDADFVTLQEFTGYTPGNQLNLTDDVYTKATYRIKAFSKDGTITANSATVDVVRDAAAVAPTSLTGNIISSSRVQLIWNAGTNARSYNLKRSENIAGPWTTIKERTTTLNLLDSMLTPATNYYYVVSTINSAGESANSTVLSIATPALVAPTTVLNPRVASGDGKAIITWEFQYDAKYTIQRAEVTSGFNTNATETWTTIATDFTGLRYEDLTAANNTSYVYKVTAYNEVGTSNPTAAMSATPKSGQQLYISFDENTTGFAEDAWGGYHAALQSAAVRDYGYMANALKMDGTTNSYATLKPGVVQSLNQFTISTWVKMTTLSNWQRIFDIGNGTNNYMFLTPQVSAANGVSVLRYAIKNGGSEQSLSYNYTWPLATWVHLAITQSADSVRMFINGTRVAGTNTITLKPGDLGATTLNYLGKSQFSADPIFQGQIDELKIFNKALTDADIAGLYSSIPLPVDLTSFDGHSTANGNQLRWVTATEKNSDYFDLQRAAGTTGQLQFETITRVKSKGNSSAKNVYSYLDATAQPGNNFYRLKQVDKDGKTEYSKNVVINTGKSLNISVYPNPVTDKLYINMPAVPQSQISIGIFSADGRKLSTVSQTASSNVLQLDMSGLNAGLYYVEVKSAGFSTTIPVIKK